jgi:hypothetical protein
MTLDELKHIFRHQTTATDDYIPKDTVDYMVFEGQNRISASCPVNEMEKLITLLDTYQFDGYRDRTPLFIKPEIIIPL